MAKDTIVILEKGTGKSEQVQNIEIPDLWHLAMFLKEIKDGTRTVIHKDSVQFLSSYADAVLDTWHKAHALKIHIIEKC